MKLQSNMLFCLQLAYRDFKRIEQWKPPRGLSRYYTWHKTCQGRESRRCLSSFPFLCPSCSSPGLPLPPPSLVPQSLPSSFPRSSIPPILPPILPSPLIAHHKNVLVLFASLLHGGDESGNGTVYKWLVWISVICLTARIHSSHMVVNLFLTGEIIWYRCVTCIKVIMWKWW